MPCWGVRACVRACVCVCVYVCVSLYQSSIHVLAARAAQALHMSPYLAQCVCYSPHAPRLPRTPSCPGGCACVCACVYLPEACGLCDRAADAAIGAQAAHECVCVCVCVCVRRPVPECLCVYLGPYPLEANAPPLAHVPLVLSVRPRRPRPCLCVCVYVCVRPSSPISAFVPRAARADRGARGARPWARMCVCVCALPHP